MPWEVNFDADFAYEVDRMSAEVRTELLAKVKLLEEFGPSLGRPSVDTLKGSDYSKMKELRFDACGGVWRVAFAFDTARAGILLVAGNKKGADQKKFYEDLIRTADKRLGEHEKEIAEAAKAKGKKK